MTVLTYVGVSLRKRGSDTLARNVSKALNIVKVKMERIEGT